MGKIFAPLLALWLLLAGSGLTLSQHYCHGDFAGVSLSLSEVVDGCEMPMGKMLNSKCCHTDHQFFKAEDPALSFVGWDLPNMVGVLSLDISPKVLPVQNPQLAIANSRAPPGKPRPVWMKYSVFLS